MKRREEVVLGVRGESPGLCSKGVEFLCEFETVETRIPHKTQQ